MVEQAQRRFAGPALSFAVDDAENLSQPDGAFGAVTCSFGLMYCYDPRAALRHMARVLQPGGRLMLLVWGRAARNENTVIGIYLRWSGARNVGSPATSGGL